MQTFIATFKQNRQELAILCSQAGTAHLSLAKNISQIQHKNLIVKVDKKYLAKQF